MDIKEALLHPGEIFSTPKEILNHPEFTKKQKRGISMGSYFRDYLWHK